MVGDTAGSCKIGYYCPSGTPIQLKCPIGTYGDAFLLQDITDCKQCPSTFYCNQKAKLADFSMNICGDGMLCNGGAQALSPSVNEGGELCPAGYYCKKGVKTKCPLGTYQPNKGGIDCLGCPAGKYCNDVGIIDPPDCPAGYYCPVIDASKITVLKYPCPAGKYSPFEGNQKVEDCLPCKEGHFCEAGSIQPTG